MDRTDTNGDSGLLRETALLLVARFQERLRDETPLDPKDIKSLSAALLDLRSQLGGGQSAPEPLTVRFVDLDGAEE
ncbi:MAG: hypothetical protein IJK63_09115 [Oscillospiraceae bacterium]|nr:hypothetical protein [Oscillospiraceae bacterium]